MPSTAAAPRETDLPLAAWRQLICSVGEGGRGGELGLLFVSLTPGPGLQEPMGLRLEGHGKSGCS